MKSPSSAADRQQSLLAPYLQLLVPLVLAHMLQSVGGLLDGLWVARLLGITGVAAISSFFPVFFVILSVIIGLSAAVSVLVGQAWGAGDFRAVRRVAGTALCVAFVLGLALALAALTGAEPLMRLLGTPPDILHEATSYARTVLVAMPLTFTLWTCMALSRGAGDPQSPLWAILAATGVGAVATPVLVSGWGGLPALGAAGAAASSIVAQCVASGVLLGRWVRARHPLLADGLRSRDVRFDLATGTRMMRIGVPASLQMLSMALAEVVLLGLVNRHGSTVTAAYGAATQLLSWIQFPAMCVGIAAAILSAHVIGAGRSHRVPAVIRCGLALNAGVTTLFALAGSLMAPAALRLFLHDPASLEVAVGMLRTVAWSVVLLGWSNVLNGALRASGIVLLPTALGMLAILAVELPAAWVLESRLGLPGLWWAYPAGFGAMLILHSACAAAHWRVRSRAVRVAAA
ncbi:MATE family efflux transporter [Ramlibacter rhizophilus]|uniref:MATE family efflux transporter n=1 Tax=Ramlibacter rhizophilus TaxID=1781167 RepID=A0A4Z0BJZ3_9BURK|nr:MATE family efflux transporter [Ramlibacter rhizophilus]TFY98577.1 MATE family efflux transporter [Ramlibacter rhizophilus]